MAFAVPCRTLFDAGRSSSEHGRSLRLRTGHGFSAGSQPHGTLGTPGSPAVLPHDGLLEIDAADIRQGRQPRENVSHLRGQLVVRSTAKGRCQLAELFGQPEKGRRVPPAASFSPYICKIIRWRPGSVKLPASLGLRVHGTSYQVIACGRPGKSFRGQGFSNATGGRCLAAGGEPGRAAITYQALCCSRYNRSVRPISFFRTWGGSMATVASDYLEGLAVENEPDGPYEVVGGRIVEKTMGAYECWLAAVLFGSLDPYNHPTRSAGSFRK